MGGVGRFKWSLRLVVHPKEEVISRDHICEKCKILRPHQRLHISDVLGAEHIAGDILEVPMQAFAVYGYRQEWHIFYMEVDSGVTPMYS